MLEFYIRQRPGNADACVGQALQQSGVLAGLAVLMERCGAAPGAEPLRSAALCCAAMAPATYNWLVAVPGFSAMLKGEAGGEARLVCASAANAQRSATLDANVRTCPPTHLGAYRNKQAPAF